MTREEAKEILQEARITSFRPNGTTRVKEAIDMAIEALIEPINCVKCDHYYETEDDTDVHGHCEMDTAHVQCNDCKWYQGVHGVQGHAPCELFNKQVLWNDFCSKGESYKSDDDEMKLEGKANMINHDDILSALEVIKSVCESTNDEGCAICPLRNDEGSGCMYFEVSPLCWDLVEHTNSWRAFK